MRVLVTGASGFVGRALLQRLLALDWIDAVAGLRKTGALIEYELPCERRVLGDLAVAAVNSDALQGVDVLVHTAARVHVMDDAATDPLAVFRAVNVEGMLRLATAAAEAGVKRFVLISSVKVNGEETPPGHVFTAADQPCPSDAYGRSKWEAEQALQALCEATDMRWVIIRPTLVYGPGVRANFHRLMGGLAHGLPLPLGALNNRRSLVALDNLLDLLLICLVHPAAVNQIFMVSDGDDWSVAELARYLARALQSPARLLPVPRSWLRSGLQLSGCGSVAQRLCGELCVDIEKTKTLLGWQPAHAVANALSVTAEDFLMRSGRC
ncbi:NAD-dependent epimerase/dehydratase family protein [Pseudomonas borbori]